VLDGEGPSLAAVGGTELGQDIGHVIGGRLGRDEQLLSILRSVNHKGGTTLSKQSAVNREEVTTLISRRVSS
jgi:hypothetical protein